MWRRPSPCATAGSSPSGSTDEVRARIGERDTRDRRRRPHGHPGADRFARARPRRRRGGGVAAVSEPAIDWRAAGLDSGQAARRPPDTWIWTPRVYPPRLRERRFPPVRSWTRRRRIIRSRSMARTRCRSTRAALRAAGITRASADPARRRDRQGRPRRADRSPAQRRGDARALPAQRTGGAAARHARARAPAVRRDRHHERHRTERDGRRAIGPTRRCSAPAGCNVRATVTLRIPHPEDAAQVERFITGLPFRFGSGDDWLKVGPLKIFVDGGILLGTAFMREPYGAGAHELYAIDDPAYRGFLTLTPEQIRSRHRDRPQARMADGRARHRRRRRRRRARRVRSGAGAAALAGPRATR